MSTQNPHTLGEGVEILERQNRRLRRALLLCKAFPLMNCQHGPRRPEGGVSGGDNDAWSSRQRRNFPPILAKVPRLLHEVNRQKRPSTGALHQRPMSCDGDAKVKMPIDLPAHRRCSFEKPR